MDFYFYYELFQLNFGASKIGSSSNIFSPFEDTKDLAHPKGLKFLKHAFTHSKLSLVRILFFFFFFKYRKLFSAFTCRCFFVSCVCPLIPTCLGGDAMTAAPLEWGTHLNGTQGWASLAQSTVSSPVANCNLWRSRSHKLYCSFSIFYPYSYIIL